MKAIFYDYKIVLKEGELAEYLEYIRLLESVDDLEPSFILHPGELGIYPNNEGRLPSILPLIIKLIDDNVPMEKGDY